MLGTMTSWMLGFISIFQYKSGAGLYVQTKKIASYVKEEYKHNQNGK